MVEAVAHFWEVLSGWDWSSILSAVGSITGIIGSITGIISLRKVSRLKALDLRMERGQLINTIQVKLDGLPDLCKKANASKIGRFVAQGISNSGAMESWKNICREYENKVATLINQFTELKGVDRCRRIEDDILNLHSVKEQACALIESLEASMAEDDVAREQLFRMRFGNSNNTAAR